MRPMCGGSTWHTASAPAPCTTRCAATHRCSFRSLRAVARRCGSPGRRRWTAGRWRQTCTSRAWWWSPATCFMPRPASTATRSGSATRRFNGPYRRGDPPAGRGTGFWRIAPGLPPRSAAVAPVPLRTGVASSSRLPSDLPWLQYHRRSGCPGAARARCCRGECRLRQAQCSRLSAGLRCSPLALARSLTARPSARMPAAIWLAAIDDSRRRKNGQG